MPYRTGLGRSSSRGLAFPGALLGGWAVFGQVVRFLPQVHGVPSLRPWESYPLGSQLARCIRSDHGTLATRDSAMSRGQTVKEAILENTPNQAVVRLWTTESNKRNAPDAWCCKWRKLLFNPKACSRSGRRPQLANTFLDHSSASHTRGRKRTTPNERVCTMCLFLPVRV